MSERSTGGFAAPGRRGGGGPGPRPESPAAAAVVEASRMLDLGLAEARAMGYPYAEAKLLAELGTVPSCRVETLAALQHSSAAARAFDRLGARADAQRVARPHAQSVRLGAPADAQRVARPPAQSVRAVRPRSPTAHPIRGHRVR